MSEKTVRQDDLAKALTALQDIAKGHSSRGTATTEVESMRDAGVGAGSDAGSTQVHHTPKNSDRQSWAGSSWSGVSSDDAVKEDGTDYDGGAVMKSIMDKLSKGQELTAREYAILKGQLDKQGDEEEMDKAYGADDDEEEAKKSKARKSKEDMMEDEEDDEEMGKSLADYASESDEVSKGLEVSEFLAGFAGVMAKSLEAMEKRVVAKITKSLVDEAEGNGEFQKSLAEAVVNLGEAITSVAQRQEQLESQPARGPKSFQNVQVLEKGGFSGPQSGEPLSKSLVASTLAEMVPRGEATAQDVIRFESSGELPEHLETKVRAAVGR